MDYIFFTRSHEECEMWSVWNAMKMQTIDTSMMLMDSNSNATETREWFLRLFVTMEMQQLKSRYQISVRINKRY